MFTLRQAVLSIVALFLFAAEVPVSAMGPKHGTGVVAIITNWGDDTISMVHTVQGKVLSVIKVGPKPYDIKVAPNGRFAYVTNSAGNTISVIDIQANLEAERIPVGYGPRDIELSDDGNFAVTANSGDDSMSYVDMRRKKQVFSIKVGSIPYGVGLAQKGRVAVITNWGEGTVSIVDLSKRKEILPRIKVGTLPYTVLVTPSGDYGYVTCFGSHKVVQIDIAKHKVVKSVPVGRSPWGLGGSSDGSLAVVANFYSADISLLSFERNRSGTGPKETVIEKSRIRLNGDRSGGEVERHAKNIAVADDKNFALITDLAGNKLMVFDLKSKKVIRSIDVGRAPYGIAFVGIPQQPSPR